MSNISERVTAMTAEGIERVLVSGDLSKLTAEQRVSYVGSVCKSLGLNALTRPFEFITLNGKLTLYAKRDATDQLRSKHKISINITGREITGGVYIVTAKAKNAEGREDEATGVVSVEGLKGDALANAMMKSESKAKRRVTLSICGLGLLDESEIETIPDATQAKEPQVNPLKEVRAQEAAVEANPGEYVVTFGKHKGIKISDIDLYALNSYVEYIQSEALKTGKEINGKVLEFMKNAGKYLESRDMESVELPEPEWDRL